MTEVLKGQIQLLISLARADGHLHKSELIFIIALMEQYKLNPSEFQHLGLSKNATATDRINNKSEFLYLALKLIQADRIISPRELSFCRNVAMQLGFKPAVVDHFAEKELEDSLAFKKTLKTWVM